MLGTGYEQAHEDIANQFVKMIHKMSNSEFCGEAPRTGCTFISEVGNLGGLREIPPPLYLISAILIDIA